MGRWWASSRVRVKVIIPIIRTDIVVNRVAKFRVWRKLPLVAKVCMQPLIFINRVPAIAAKWAKDSYIFTIKGIVKVMAKVTSAGSIKTGN